MGSTEMGSQPPSSPSPPWLWDSSGLCQTPIKLYKFS